MEKRLNSSPYSLVLWALLPVLFISTITAQMATDGKAKPFQKISAIEGNFTLANDDGYGASMTSIGDLTGDGIADLAVRSFQDDGGIDRGVRHIPFPNTISDVSDSFLNSLGDEDIMWSI